MQKCFLIGLLPRLFMYSVLALKNDGSRLTSLLQALPRTQDIACVDYLNEVRSEYTLIENKDAATRYALSGL